MIGELYPGEFEAMEHNGRMDALDQEPCEDAISREAVCDYIAEFINNEYSSQAECEMVDAMIEGIQHLPPVKSQPKTGHWVDIDEEPHEVWECDHCGFVIDGSGCIDPYDYRDTYKFCPNCGAMMVESQ